MELLVLLFSKKMVKKKSPIESLSSIGSYSHASQDVDLEGFVVDDDDASDVELRYVDAMKFRRGILLGEVKRDIKRKVNEDLFDEAEYSKRMIKADLKDLHRDVMLSGKRKCIADVEVSRSKRAKSSSSSPKSASKTTSRSSSKNSSRSISASSRMYAQSLSLMREKPMNINLPARATSAPSRYRAPRKATSSKPNGIKELQRKEMEIRKNVVALFNNDRQVFQHGKKKGVLGIEDPLGLMIAATGCLPEKMFNKGLESDDQEELNAHSNMVAKLILGGDKDPQLRWLIFMNRDQLKIIISHIYSEHLWSIPETASNAGKREIRERWLAFLLYLTSRCLDVHYEEFVETILDMFADNIKLGIQELMETYNENPFGLQYYVCSYYAEKSDRYKSSSSPRIVSGRRRRNMERSAKGQDLRDLMARRKALQKRKAASSNKSPKKRIKRRRAISSSSATR